MNTHELSIIEKAYDLHKMKKKNPAAFAEKPLKRPVGRPAKPENLIKVLRKARAAADAPVQLQLLGRQLTGGPQGMKEFRYEPPTPQEERQALLKTGILAGGVLGAGGLAALGIYKSGVSGFARKAERLARVVKNVSANRAAGVRRAKEAAQQAAEATGKQKADYAKAAQTFYGKGQDKHAAAVIKAQSAKARASKAAAKAQADAARAAAAKASAGPTKTTVPEDVFEKAAAAQPPPPAPRPTPPPPKKYKTYIQAKGALRRGEITEEQLNAMKFSARVAGLREFSNFQTDEGGVPFTGKVAKDRFIKKLRDEDLDRRDANILRAGAAGGLAGLLLKAPLSAGKRGLIGAGLGGAGVIGTRLITERTRDVYGERSHGGKRAEMIPSAVGLGLAGYLAARRLGFKGINPAPAAGAAPVAKAASAVKSKAARATRAAAGGKPGVPFAEQAKKWAKNLSGIKRDPSYLEAKLGGMKEFRAGAALGNRLFTGKKAWQTDPEVRADFVKRVTAKVRAAVAANKGQYPASKAKALSALQRGLKEFDDYKLYYFRGRNTGIAARSAEEARKKKKRGGDELVAVRTPNETERSQMARGIWVRTRRDGKSPEKSRYGKGRGQGPARKSMGAKLRGVKELSRWAFIPHRGKTAELLTANLRDQKAISPLWSGYVDSIPLKPLRVRANKTVGDLEKQHVRLINHLHGKRSPIVGGYAQRVSDQRSASLDRRSAVAGMLKDYLQSQKKFCARQRAVKFFEKKKEKKSGGLNPYVGAALSGGASGAVLGGLSILRRGVKPMNALGNAAKLGAISAGIVGGGALLGSAIIGKPREDEGAPFTKRAGLGGAIAGAGAGLVGGLALRKTRAGARMLVNASKGWRPAMWIRKSPLAAGVSLGGLSGGLYGLAQGLDEGQQVDSIRNLKKDLKNELPMAHAERAAKSVARSYAGFSSKLALREFGAFGKALKWYRGENMSGMQRMALAQARKVSPKAAQSLKAGFIKDNRNANKLVLGAGVVPPVLTTGLGVAATYHSAGLGKKEKKEMSALHEFRASPLPNVEPMEVTRSRRNEERSNFLRTVGTIGAVGLAGIGGFKVAKSLGKAQLNAARRGVDEARAAAEKAAVRAEAYRAEAAAERARRSSGGGSGGFWDEFYRHARGTSGSGGYNSDYARKSAEAKAKWNRENQGGSGSSKSSKSSGGSKDYSPPPRSNARGAANPYAGTDKADKWERYQSMRRMAEESPHEGERTAAAAAAAKWKKRYGFARKLRGLKMFGRADQPRDPATKRYKDPLWSWASGEKLIKINPDGTQSNWSPDSPQLVNSALAHAGRARVPIQRTGRMTKDVSDVLQGKERERDASGRIKKREWEKSWFQNYIAQGAIAAGALGGAFLWRRGMKNPNSRLGRVVGNINAGVRRTKDDVRKAAGDFMNSAGTWTDKQQPFMKKLLAARVGGLKELDAYAAQAGWDVRDPRGRSARVFAPGSRRRERREKAWHERAENERKLWMAGLAGTALVGGAGAIAAVRLAKGKSLVPSWMTKRKTGMPEGPSVARRADGKFAPNAVDPTGGTFKPGQTQSEETKRKLRDFFASGGTNAALIGGLTGGVGVGAGIHFKNKNQ